MTIIEFLWTVASCLNIGLLSYFTYTLVRNDIRSELERLDKRQLRK